jgi:hypothetical protein
LRHYYPSVGDPFALPLPKFYRYYANLTAIDDRKSGESSTPQGVLRQLLKT